MSNINRGSENAPRQTKQPNRHVPTSFNGVPVCSHCAAQFDNNLCFERDNQKTGNTWEQAAIALLSY